MRVLFFMRHAGYVRNFEPVLRELAARDHSVHVAFGRAKAYWLDGHDPVGRIGTPGLTSGSGPSIDHKRTVKIARGLRLYLDYLRYLEPEYRDAARLRARAGKNVHGLVRSFPGLRLRVVRHTFRAALRRLERLVPCARAVDHYMALQEPDVVLVTPLVGLGSIEVEFVRAARRLGIPCVHCVASWDNLTNKGLLHELPDAAIVWNDAQREECVQLHGMPRERIVVSGAQCYDHWFDWRPRSTREDFCRQVGLRADRPIVLYVCSSGFVAPDEAPYIRRWIQALRSTRPPLSEAGVLVRPHPQNAEQWVGFELGDSRAVVWPPFGADPVDDATKQDYFDSMYHAAAVVGVNTSALIESAIVGRPVHTLLAQDFAETQVGTLHFAHLAGGNGPLQVAHTLEEHLNLLSASLDSSEHDQRRRDFVARFVRPHGVDRVATVIFADAVERIAGHAPPAARSPSRSRREPARA